MNLPEFLDLRKEPGRTLLLCLVVILVGLAAFALGRLSVGEPSQPSLRLVGASEASAIGAATANKGEAESGAVTSDGESMPQAGGVVASKSGTKYHFPWCAGAKSIKDSNKIWFSTTNEARAAGYQPASNCKGLE